MVRIYALENKLGTKLHFKMPRKVYTVWKGEQRIAKPETTFEAGICTGLSLLWISKVLEGVPMADTKPDSHRAAVVQALYQLKKSSVEGVMDAYCAVGLAPTRVINGLDSEEVLHQVLGEFGVYHLMAPGHSMAVKVAARKYHFFDAETGLYEYVLRTNFSDAITNLMEDVVDKAWMAVHFE